MPWSVFPEKRPRDPGPWLPGLARSLGLSALEAPDAPCEGGLDARGGLDGTGQEGVFWREGEEEEEKEREERKERKERKGEGGELQEKET